ncbi:MAG: RDD family protein [Tissierellia bacterium]|nr:RDD family protein [Tissierellia bacterium]
MDERDLNKNLEGEQNNFEINDDISQANDESNRAFAENDMDDNFESEDERRHDINQKKASDSYEEDFKYNKYPNFFFSGFFTRLFAFTIDSIIAASISKLLIDGSINLFLNDYYIPKSVYNLAHIIVFLLYFTIMTYATNGQTLGKMIFGIRVVSFKEERLKLSTVIVREFFGRYIYTYGILFLLYAICGFTSKKQHLMDMIADTSVVNENTIKAYLMHDIENYKEDIAY